MDAILNASGSALLQVTCVKRFCYVHSQRIAKDFASGVRRGYTVCLPVSVCARSPQGFQTQLCFEQFRHNSREAQEVDNFIK